MTGRMATGLAAAWEFWIAIPESIPAPSMWDPDIYRREKNLTRLFRLALTQ